MKELLEKLAAGTATVDEVLQALDDENKDKVPRSRLNDKNDEIKDLKTQLDDRDTQLKDLIPKAAGNEDLQNQIKLLQDANKTAADEYESKLSKQTYDFALDRALLDAKARNPVAVKALLNMDAVKLDGDKLFGLDEQLKALQESDDYLFVQEQQQQQKPPGYTPGSSQKGNDPKPADEYTAARERARQKLKK
jgi:hypothetical protein